MSKITFPESFEKKPHSLGGGWQWLLKDDDKVLISIIGGSYGLYGDGVKTFEMWDYNEENPQGYLSIEDINKHLDEFHNI